MAEKSKIDQLHSIVGGSKYILPDKSSSTVEVELEGNITIEYVFNTKGSKLKEISVYQNSGIKKININF